MSAPWGTSLLSPSARASKTRSAVIVTVVNVALPTIGEELHATVAQLQWIVNAYTLTLAGLILLGGSLGDRYGRLVCPSVGFIAASRVDQRPANDHRFCVAPGKILVQVPGRRPTGRGADAAIEATRARACQGAEPGRRTRVLTGAMRPRVT
jgi:hypothetical protein